MPFFRLLLILARFKKPKILLLEHVSYRDFIILATIDYVQKPIKEDSP